MDPPYDKGLEVPTIKHLDQVNLLKETGIIAVEHMSCSVLPRIIGDFIKYDLKKYGKTTISFYRKRSCNQ
jgi:16S rRNA G966 N2-methylase RsmD